MSSLGQVEFSRVVAALGGGEYRGIKAVLWKHSPTMVKCLIAHGHPYSPRALKRLGFKHIFNHTYGASKCCSCRGCVLARMREIAEALLSPDNSSKGIGHVTKSLQNGAFLYYDRPSLTMEGEEELLSILQTLTTGLHRRVKAVLWRGHEGEIRLRISVGTTYSSRKLARLGFGHVNGTTYESRDPHCSDLDIGAKMRELIPAIQWD